MQSNKFLIGFLLGIQFHSLSQILGEAPLFTMVYTFLCCRFGILIPSKSICSSLELLGTELGESKSNYGEATRHLNVTIPSIINLVIPGEYHSNSNFLQI